VDSLLEEIKPAAAKLNDVLDEAEKTLSEVRKQVAGDSTQMYQLRSTLAEVESAAESVRTFFEYMERNPEALLRGKH
jgi:paraquat-inducible protein B